MRQTSKKRVFTVEEANALLPQLRGLLEGVREEVRFQRTMAAGVRRAAERSKLGGGGAPGGAAYVESLGRLRCRLAEVQDLGVEVKDPEMGLCDFLHRREGRLVYLCWHVGEERIAYWHDLHAGFQGRVPL